MPHARKTISLSSIPPLALNTAETLLLDEDFDSFLLDNPWDGDTMHELDRTDPAN